jgi:hypothetical protein
MSEDAFDRMDRVMTSRGGHLIVVGEVLRERDAALAENKRLRGRLRELEWGRWDSECPACGSGSAGGDNYHEDDCWLAAELRSP